MALNIYDTHTLLMAVEQVIKPTTFLRDRYFPTNEVTDVFSTNDVLVEYKNGSRKLAPFVAPRKGGVTILRNGSYMERYTPPRIAPKRGLTLDDIKQRGFGEALFTQLTPEQRQLVMIMNDIKELDETITRREEVMAAETMITNGCIMKHIADDINLTYDMEIRFYSESTNPSKYTPATKWGQAGAKIIDDINAMIKMLTTNGLPATDLIISGDVVPIILNDETIQKMLDIRYYNMGMVEPIELPNGASRIARINVYGRMIDIISYDETYENEEGEIVPYIPSGTVILTAPAAGRRVYGAVNQVEQFDGNIHTYPAARVPKYVSDANQNTRTLTLTSCPLLIPNHKNPWVVANVIE